MNRTKNTNVNALAGMRCPHCGQFDAFRIEVASMCRVTDDGIEDEERNGWVDTAYCECVECDKTGTVADFQGKEG